LVSAVCSCLYVPCAAVLCSCLVLHLSICLQVFTVGITVVDTLIAIISAEESAASRNSRQFGGAQGFMHASPSR
jgi:hypothetical protein